MNAQEPPYGEGLIIDKLYVTKGNSTLLDALSVQIHPGQCIAVQSNHITGQLIIDLLMNRAKPSAGSVTWRGVPLSSASLATKIGWIRQGDPLYERLTPKDALIFYMKMYGAYHKDRLEQLLKLTGLHECVNTPLGKCTLSEQRRFHLARAAAHRPELIVIEDPEFHMDLESSYLLRQWINTMCEEGASIFMTVPSLESALTMTNHVVRLTPSGFKSVIIEDEAPETGALPEVEIIENDEHTTDAVQQVLAAVAEDGGQEGTGTTKSLNEDVSSQPSTKDKKSTLQAAENEEDEPESAASGQRFVPQISFDKIPARIEDKIVLIDPLELNYIESQDGASQLYMHSGSLPCTMTLTELERKLKAFGFFRCHRSYLVNLQRVREVIIWSRNSYSLVLDDENKSKVPLSKNKYEEMKAIMGIG
ncbi:LytTR family transcriptional regulator DNA-binding domain-containing protein [Paenibacillus sp. NAIST15-1]|uniref:LytTR family transcriptional regulator DNA-binding domain-containing protein n=1 Tax=Paenibacillus sp. NAIST15-1 TaxID=1605994 RepID=UPI00086C7923|nr:LytTR family transcriptional regulator DNA-binding domain-containing protein [Paenibacillus sp. NAIST15-1]GAV12570.1 ABC-type multidrug transport system, ATPase component [Paenibacillus sp. NAIST15-1]